MGDRSKEMVDELKRCSTPDICGYVERDGAILFVGPFTPTPRPKYAPSDLQKALDAVWLEKRRFIGSVSFEFCGLPVCVGSDREA